jgi:putative aldouronate transport system substrate-binding protein
LSSTPTTDEFYTEMKKLVGKGVVPFSFPKFMDNLPMFYNPFGGYPGLVQDKDGKYYDAFNTQETKDALTYLNKLYKEGILDKEFITNENTVMRDKLITGKAASNIDYYNRLIFYSPESARNNTSTEFVPIYELKGPKGKGGNLNESIQDAYLISDKSKNKQRAFEVAEWIVYTEEGSRLTRLGVQDKHYTVKDGLFTPIEKASTSGYKATANSFFLSFVDVKNFGFKWDETTEKYLPQQLVINAEAQKHLGPKYVVPGGLSTLYDNIQPEYKKKIEEIAASIIMGNISLAEGYKQYESWWKSIDGDAMLKELNKK